MTLLHSIASSQLPSLPSLEAVERELAKRSLKDFARFAWPFMVPNSRFIDNWHIDAMSEHLEALARDELPNGLLITMPPRHMKSLMVSVAFPAWVWAQGVGARGSMGPGVRFLSSSYAYKLAERDASATRELIRTDWYRRRFPHVRIKAAMDQKTRYDTTKGGSRVVTSVSGSNTGEGGDIILIDDPHNVKEVESETVRHETIRWFDEVMPTRLNNPGRGGFVIVMQRSHEGDLAGHILSKNLGFTHLCLPARFEHDHPHVWAMDPRKQDGLALWPNRFPDAEITKLEQAMGSYASAGQLQQRPAPREGGLFKRHWFKVVPAPPANRRRVRSWDLAATEKTATTNPDWTASVLLSVDDQGRYYIEDAFRLQGSALTVETALENTASLDRTATRITIPQDPGQAGKAQAQALVRKLAGYDVRVVSPTGAKEVRAAPLSAQAEAGNVFLVEADWNREFLDELCMFPGGRHDDFVDAAADAFNTLSEKGKGGGFAGVLTGGHRR